MEQLGLCVAAGKKCMIITFVTKLKELRMEERYSDEN